jgi:predicted dinucleotide-binding enzyme
MKVGIVVVGNMGSNLGNLFAKHGHEVMFSFSHDPQQIRQAVTNAGPNARSGTPEQARFGDIVLLAVGWGAVKAALQATGSLDGKTLISCVNP